MTIIGPSLIINGDVSSSEDVTVHGKVTGKVTMAEGVLLIAQNATVEAEAHAARLTIQGAFSGDINATERVELTPTATMNGTIVAPSVVLQDGAVFNGAIEVQRHGTSRAARTSAPPVPVAKAS